MCQEPRGIKKQREIDEHDNVVNKIARIDSREDKIVAKSYSRKFVFR